MMVKKYKCPFNRKTCMEGECALWREFMIENVVTGEIKSVSNCILRQLPDMLIDLIKNTVGLQAATESFRNETVKRQDAFLSVIADTARKKLKAGDR